MSSINKISGVSFSTNVFAVDGVSKSSIGSINGISAPSSPSSQTAYVSSGLEFHINANDTNSWNGTTTWTDLAGTENMTLVNGPTKPSGAEYVAFDGNDDRGEINWGSSDYFYGSNTDYTFWDEFSLQIVISWPEDGSTGLIHRDGLFGAGNRYQVGNNRGFRYLIGRWQGIGFDMFYGTIVRFLFPNTSDFQYNSSRSAYEPIPDRVYSIAVTMDRTSTPHLSAYINGSLFTPDSVTGSATQVGGTSQANATYINNSNVRKGRTPWYVQQTQQSNGTFTSSAITCNIHEMMLYNRKISASEVQQNLDAYTDRYGALN